MDVTLRRLGPIVLLTVACRSGRPPSLDGYSAPDGGSGGGPSFAGGDPAPSCAGLVLPDDGAFCECVDVEALSDVPILYFVLDRSGSMRRDDKWTRTREVLADVALAVGPRARFAAAVFPGVEGTCSAGFEVVAPMQGDRPAGVSGPTTERLLRSTALEASGGTPTSATLASLEERVRSFGGKTFVILATDGGPNCGENTTCSVDRCIANIESVVAQCTPEGPLNCCAPDFFGPLNCIDDAEALAVLGRWRASGISTYVIGIPGSEPYAAVLDAFATAGGTARSEAPSKYYSVGAAEAVEFRRAVATVAAQAIGSCRIPLRQGADRARTNVYLDGVAVAPHPEHGWRFENDDVLLQGETCERVLRGDVLNVRVVAGCQTVVR